VLKEHYPERGSMQTSNVSSTLLANYQKLISVNHTSCQDNTTHSKYMFWEKLMKSVSFKYFNLNWKARKNNKLYIYVYNIHRHRSWAH
jgi:hypothetical protein